MNFHPLPTSLTLRRTVEVEAPAEVVSGRIEEFLENCGYRREEAGWPARFGRGRVGLTAAAFTPRMWRVEVTADLKQEPKRCVVEVIFRIDTTGQIATVAENEYWAAELKGLEDAALTGRTSAGDLHRKARAVLRNNILTAVLVIGLTFLGLGAGACLGTLVENRILGVILVLVGGVAPLFVSLAILVRWFGHHAGCRGLPPDS